MWPFTPRFVELPNGKTITYKAFRQREKIENKKLAARTKKELAHVDLDITKEQEAYVEEKTDKRESKKSQRWEGIKKRIAMRVQTAASRVANDLPLLFALICLAIFVPVTLAGQLMFFGALPWPNSFAWLRYPLAVSAEIGSWTMAVFAWSQAREKKPYHVFTRLMWTFAGAAAVMNGYHGVHVLKEPSMVWALGTPSVIGPAIWHFYLFLKKSKLSNRNPLDLITERLNKIYHPFLMLRTNRLWAESKGRMSREQAWLEVFQQRFGHLPGQRQRSRQVTFRHNWLWRLVRRITGPVMGQQITFKVVQVVVVSAPQRTLRVDSQRADMPSAEIGQRADQSADWAADLGADCGPADLPLGALTGGVQTLPADDFQADFDAWLAELSERADSTADSTAEVPQRQALTSGTSSSSEAVSGAESARQVSAVSDPSEGVAQRADDTADQRADQAAETHSSQRADMPSRQRSASGRQRRRSARQVSGRVDYTGPVTDYFNRRVAEGADPAEITGRQAAEATGAAESTARNILSELRKGVTK